MINIENNMSNMKALFSFEQIGMERIFDISIISKQPKNIAVLGWYNLLLNERVHLQRASQL